MDTRALKIGGNKPGAARAHREISGRRLLGLYTTERADDMSDTGSRIRAARFERLRAKMHPADVIARQG